MVKSANTLNQGQVHNNNKLGIVCNDDKLSHEVIRNKDGDDEEDHNASYTKREIPGVRKSKVFQCGSN